MEPKGSFLFYTILTSDPTLSHLIKRITIDNELTIFYINSFTWKLKSWKFKSSIEFHFQVFLFKLCSCASWAELTCITSRTGNVCFLFKLYAEKLLWCEWNAVLNTMQELQQDNNWNKHKGKNNELQIKRNLSIQKTVIYYTINLT